MSDVDGIEKLLPIIGTGGGWAVVIYILWRIGNAMVASIDKLGNKIDIHTDKDLSTQAAVKQDIVRMDSRQEGMDRKLDKIIDRMWDDQVTPVDMPKRRSPGEYRRGKTGADPDER